MERVNQILKHPVFLREQERIRTFEKERIYCGHRSEHLLDVARIGWIMILEEKLTIEKPIFYAAALLHDIGRAIQYETGEAHQLAGIPLARQVLKDCGYEKEEQENILEAVRMHRTYPVNEKNLAGVLYRADKKSRACYCCESEPLCNWSVQKKNLNLQY
ncbi:phosphodiesterase [Clostridiales bacterium CHKCI001]|nr:phosphodiesterase [Clostridiales bacterium CHKCI001]